MAITTQLTKTSWSTGEATKLSVWNEGTGARFGLDSRAPGATASLGATIRHSDLIEVRDMLTEIIDGNAANDYGDVEPYQPHTHPALSLENWNGGPVNMLLADEGDSVSLSATLEIEGLTMETVVRLSPDTVTAMQKRLADIRAHRGW